MSRVELSLYGISKTLPSYFMKKHEENTLTDIFRVYMPERSLTEQANMPFEKTVFFLAMKRRKGKRTGKGKGKEKRKKRERGKRTLRGKGRIEKGEERRRCKITWCN